VIRAKEYPIDELIKFSQGKARCLWHNEKTGSMHFYKETNRVHCFGCGKGGDAIDVYMALNNVAFKDAVEKLQ
jgi:DNA primase